MSTLKHFALMLGLLLLGAAANAAPAPTHTAKIDPQAKQLLTQMEAAYKTLTSYSDTSEVKAISGGKTVDILAQVALKKPNLANIQVTQNALITQVVADGTSVYATTSSEKMHYTKEAAAAGTDALAQAFQRAGAAFFGHSFFQEKYFIPELLNDPACKSVVVGPASDLAGVQTDTVIATIGGGGNSVFTFFIARNDHLLRKLTISRSARSAPFLIETHANVMVNPDLPDSTFMYLPPAGAKELVAPADAQDRLYDPRLIVGTAPFAFQATDLSGKPVTLEQYKGRVVLLDFWATWCPPCREEIPNVVAAYEKYHPKGFDVVGLSLDQKGDRAKLVSFLSHNHMAWRQVYDGGYWQSKIPRLYGVQSIPFALLIGRDGKIAAVGVRGDSLQPAIEAALAQ